MDWKHIGIGLLASVWGAFLVSCTVPTTGEGIASADEPKPTAEESAPPIADEIAPKPKEISPAVEVQKGDGITLWLTDEETGTRVQQLMQKESQDMSAEISADQQWIVVSDTAFSDLQTLHLFKRTGPQQFTKIEREKFTGGLWDEFTRELSHPGVFTRYSTTFKEWKDDDAMVLQLGVLPKSGDWISKDYVVELAGF